MKLRILGNSLRLRVTRSEAASIGRGEAVETGIEFAGGARLIYRLEAKRELKRMEAVFTDAAISIGIPWADAMAWAASDQVALQSPTGNGRAGAPDILIEKDFFCLKPRANQHEDESDLFPNPNVAHGSCGAH